ncbi:MAG TPA: hypothetical protein VKB65_07615 [Myxococcota bacterium]|nr:hypothetical protein [Myxococcota bacterium]
MRWIARRVMNGLMGAFVGAGVAVDEQGRLCLPDGLTPQRVHRFIEHCTQQRYAHPRAAMHALFRQVGVEPRAVGLLNDIVHEGGDVDLAAVARHGPRLVGALPQLLEIPERFRAFLVDDLAIAEPGTASLENTVASARRRAAERLGCPADWDALLDRGDGIAAIAEPWRARTATA